jgi:hypothetical protein
MFMIKLQIETTIDNSDADRHSLGYPKRNSELGTERPYFGAAAVTSNRHLHNQ